MRNKRSPRWVWSSGIIGHQKSVGICTCCGNSGRRLFDRGWRERRSGSVVPNTTDRSAVDHPNTFGPYLREDVGNGEGRGGNYSVTIGLGRTAPWSTDSEPYRLCVTLVALGCAQVPGSGLVRNLDRSCRMVITALNWGTSCNSVHAMHS